MELVYHILFASTLFLTTILLDKCIYQGYTCVKSEFAILKQTPDHQPNIDLLYLSLYCISTWFGSYNSINEHNIDIIIANSPRQRKSFLLEVSINVIAATSGSYIE